MPTSKTQPSSGVMIRVKDLDTARRFYRDFLMLGNPVVDSAFWVEFNAPDGTRIILEKTEAEYLVHDVSATTLVLATPHLEEVRKELEMHNYPIDRQEKAHPGEVFYRGLDPENNVFYLCTL